MFNKFTVLTASAAVAFAMGGSAFAKDAPRVGMSFQEMNNPYFTTMHAAVKEAVSIFGDKAVLYVADARHDVTKQISDVEDMLEKGIDILLLNPADSEGVQRAVVEAKNKGVIIVSIDAQAKGPVDSFVGSKNYDAGLLSCGALAKEIGGKGDVAILDGIPVVPILERVRGCKDALAKHPGIKMVTLQNGRQERDIAMTTTENILQSQPNLKGLFSVNDEGSMGALAAITASGKNIVLTSVDGSPEAIKAITAGSAFKATAAQFPRDQIRIGFGIALAKYLGANVPAEIPIDVKLIDKSNAAGFSW
jgi:ribose transport system substrate-binding protein